MNQSHILDKVIKEIDKAEASSQAKIKDSRKKIVIVDKTAKTIITKIPLFSGKNIIYYLVANNNDATNIAECQKILVEITDFAQNRKLGICAAYRASCPAGNEEKVAQSLCGDHSPGSELDRKIQAWIAKLTDDRAAEFIDDYPNTVNQLQNDLKRTAQEEVGLKIDFRLFLDQDEQQLDEFGQEIFVRVSDWDEELELQFKTKLIVANRLKAKANLGDGWEISLIKLTKQEINKYLLKSTTISQFYYELKDTVRNGLVSHLDEILNEKGWKVGYLYLDSKKVALGALPKELVEIHYAINCTVQKYSKPVSVENTLQMLPKDVRRYISAQSPNLQAWAKSKLEKIVKTALLEKNYSDILESFEKESEEIKKEMLSEADAIGYAIKHIVSLPQMEHTYLKEKIEIKNEKAEFSTNQSGIKIKLTTTVTAKFESFTKIKDDLNQTVNQIKELMRETVNSTTREILRTVDPERFYMRFYEPAPGEKSVEQELKNAVKKALEERFGAIVGSIVPIPEETEIVDYLQRLMGMIGFFECQVPSLTGGDTVKFQGDFKIISVEQGSWYTFQSRFQSRQKSQLQLREELDALKKQHSKLIGMGDLEDNREEIEGINQRVNAIENEIFGLDDIKKSIEKSINAKLVTVDSELLMYRDIQHLSTMERYINQWAKESVVEQHGLDINIRHLTRTRTKQEEHLFKTQQELEIAKINEAKEQLEARNKQRQKLLEMSSRREQAKSDELNKLYERRLKIIADADLADPDELKSLDEQIEHLEVEILNPSLEKVESILELMQPKKDKERGILQFEEQVRLTSSQTHLDLDSKNKTNLLNNDDKKTS